MALGLESPLKNCSSVVVVIIVIIIIVFIYLKTNASRNKNNLIIFGVFNMSDREWLARRTEKIISKN